MERMTYPFGKYRLGSGHVFRQDMRANGAYGEHDKATSSGSRPSSSVFSCVEDVRYTA